jgi:glucan biosynthesis protein C
VIFAALLAISCTGSWPARLPEWVHTIVDIYISGFVPWFIILTLLAYGKRILNFTHGFLRYFAEASYPLYILHQTVIVIIGFYVVQADVAVPVKYIVIVACSFCGSLLVYDALVRRSNVIRFLFGMRARVKKSSGV